MPTAMAPLRLAAIAAACSCLLAFGQSGSSPLPELPADVPSNADVRMILSDRAAAGQDAVWTDPDGTIHEFFQFNDRGRGPRTYTTYRTNSAGLVVAEHSSGVNYMKTPVEEAFSLREGQADWKNQSENQKISGVSGKYYIDLDAGPESGALLARALLKNGNRLPLLPSGQASIRRVTSLPVEKDGKKLEVALYEMNGLGFTPAYIWLDQDLRFFAVTPSWSPIIRQGYEPTARRLAEAQQAVEQDRAQQLSRTLTHRPAGDVIVKDVSVFDSLTGTVLANRRITVRGPKILSVEAERNQGVPGNAVVVEGAGKMALPGLWDMHQHLGADTAFLDVAAGITTIRDLGNPPAALAKLRADIPEKQIGPHIICAGFIDGRGPFQGPISVFADTPEEALAQVEQYAGQGCVQIKIYSSMKTELVPIIAAEAHRRGMRVSGHVPAGMVAEQFVNAGADEIQHINFIMLNFMPDVKETRNPDRFIMPGRRSAGLDLGSDSVNQFIAFLKQHNTVIDPTMSVFEGTYVDRPGTITAVDAAMFDRLPVQAQRGAKSTSEALPASDDATDRLYRASWANMVRMLKKLHDGGVTIVAGTDQGSGYALDRELEIYTEAGIPAPDVLRIATMQAATVMHHENSSGSITAGKDADLILIQGDPTKHIRDIRNVEMVILGGAIYRPSEMYPAMGIRAN